MASLGISNGPAVVVWYQPNSVHVWYIQRRSMDHHKYTSILTLLYTLLLSRMFWKIIVRLYPKRHRCSIRYFWDSLWFRCTSLRACSPGYFLWAKVYSPRPASQQRCYRNNHFPRLRMLFLSSSCNCRCWTPLPWRCRGRPRRSWLCHWRRCSPLQNAPRKRCEKFEKIINSYNENYISNKNILSSNCTLGEIFFLFYILVLKIYMVAQ